MPAPVMIRLTAVPFLGKLGSAFLCYAAGILCGILGYAVGNYLGLGFGAFLGLFT